MAKIKYFERRYEALSLDYRIWVNGVEVTGWVIDDGPTWSLAGRGGKNSMSFSLNNSSNNFIITPENLNGEWRLGGQAYFDESAKMKMFQFKQRLNKIINDKIAAVKAKGATKPKETAPKPAPGIAEAVFELLLAGIPVLDLYPDLVHDLVQEATTEEEKSFVKFLLNQAASGIQGNALAAAQPAYTVATIAKQAVSTIAGALSAFDACKDAGNRYQVNPGDPEHVRIWAATRNLKEKLECKRTVLQQVRGTQALTVERYAELSLAAERALLQQSDMGDAILRRLAGEIGLGELEIPSHWDGKAQSAYLRRIKEARELYINRVPELQKEVEALDKELEELTVKVAIIDQKESGTQRASKAYQYLDETQRAYSLREYECIIHKYDHVRVWQRNPYTAADEWYPAFTGVVTSKPVSMDYRNGNARISVTCEDVRVLLDRMRFQRNRVATVDLVVDPFVDEGYFRDIIVGEDAVDQYTHPLSRVGSFRKAMLIGTVGGNRLPVTVQSTVGGLMVNPTTGSQQSITDALADASAAITGAVLDLQEKLDRIAAAGGDPAEIRNAVLEAVHIIQGALAVRHAAEQAQAALDPALAPYNVEGFGKFTLGFDVNTAMVAMGDWYKLLLLGDIHSRTRGDIKRTSFYTTKQMVAISEETKPEGKYSVLAGKVHFLAPSSNNIIAFDVVSSGYMGKQDFDRQWITRLQALEEMCELVDYEFYVTGAGDIVFEFPQADYRPTDYGDDVSRILSMDMSVADIRVEEEAGDIVTGVMATGGYVWQEVAVQHPSHFALKAIVWSPMMAAFRYGTHIDTVAFPFVANRTQLMALAKIAFMKKLAQMNTCTVTAAYRPFVLPNKPIHLIDRDQGLERMVCSNAISYGTPTWNQPSFSFDAKWIRMPTGWRTVKDRSGKERRERVFTLVTGRESLPLSYKDLYPQDVAGLTLQEYDNANIQAPVGVVTFNNPVTGTGSTSGGVSVDVDAEWETLKAPLDINKLTDPGSELTESEQKNITETGLLDSLQEAQNITGVPQGLLFGLIRAMGSGFEPNVQNKQNDETRVNEGDFIGMTMIPASMLASLGTSLDPAFAGVKIDKNSLTVGSPTGIRNSRQKAVRNTVAATATYIQQLQKNLDADGLDSKDPTLIAAAYVRGYKCMHETLRRAQTRLGYGPKDWNLAVSEQMQNLFDEADASVANSAAAVTSGNCHPLPFRDAHIQVRDNIAKSGLYSAIACSYADSGIRVEWMVMGSPKTSGTNTTPANPTVTGNGSVSASTAATVSSSASTSTTPAATVPGIGLSMGGKGQPRFSTTVGDVGGKTGGQNAAKIEVSLTGEDGTTPVQAGEVGKYMPDAILAVYPATALNGGVVTPAYTLAEFVRGYGKTFKGHFFKLGKQRDAYAADWPLEGPWPIQNRVFTNLKRLCQYLVILETYASEFIPGKFKCTGSGGIRLESYYVWRRIRSAGDKATKEQIDAWDEFKKQGTLGGVGRGSAHYHGYAIDCDGIVGLDIAALPTPPGVPSRFKNNATAIKAIKLYHQITKAQHKLLHTQPSLHNDNCGWAAYTDGYIHFDIDNPAGRSKKVIAHTQQIGTYFTGDGFTDAEAKLIMSRSVDAATIEEDSLDDGKD